MKSSTCSRRARERLKPDIRCTLAQHSRFACSICGAIPIVFHHIEEWSKRFSNDAELIIPICDKCHRRIHGQGGTVFSKDELYQYKTTPKRPEILKDTLPLGAKKHYSFFVGNNFIADGEKGSLFRLPDGHSLMSIDTSLGTLGLSIIVGVDSDIPIYLIKQNELLISTDDIWDMRYSGSVLKIWRIVGGKKSVVVDLAIEPDVIIMREMNGSFNGKPFRVRKLRAPQRRSVNKIESKVKEYEGLYHELSERIDSQPRIGGVYDGIDIDALVKRLNKNRLKIQLEQDLNHGFCREFTWGWAYYQWVLEGVLEHSSVFGKTEPEIVSLTPEFRALDHKVGDIKARYKQHFAALCDVVAEYNGMVFRENFLF